MSVSKESKTGKKSKKSKKKKKRNYKREYALSKKAGEQGTGSENNGAKRKRARRAALKLGMIKKGQDLDHKKPLSKGGSNKKSNWRATSPSKNRSFKRKSDGSMA